MSGDVPPELITVETFGGAWAGICALWTLAWIVGAVFHARRKAPIRVRLHIIMAATGPVGWGLWAVYRHRVAYNPETGVAGLHLVSVLLVHIALFVVVGALIGYLLARFAAPADESDAAT